MQNIPRSASILILFVFISIGACRQTHGETIHIVYSANINCALDDCKCGDETAGGMNRLVAKLKALRHQFPQALLLDAGDFLNSYSMPAGNKTQLAMMALAGYDAVNIGDQEFVEGHSFLATIRDTLSGTNLLSANISGNCEKFLKPSGLFSRNNVRVAITGFVAPTAFDFIPIAPDRAEDPLTTLSAVSGFSEKSGDLQILLFHGKWDEAKTIVDQYPWIDIILLAHNQEKKVERYRQTTLAECGADGQYVGLLEISRNADDWKINNRFLAVTADLSVDPAAQKLLEKYYQAEGLTN